MHEKIICFSEEGLIKDDKDFIRLRAEFEGVLTETMKYKGYLPVHDMSSHWSTSFDGEKYSFKITMYGAFAGKRKAVDYDFWYQGKLIKSG